MAEVIDAHHHLWRYTEMEYGWITPDLEVLKRHFLPEEFGREMLVAGVDGAVVVQARQCLAETRWLLSCAESSPFIRGVVGWMPLADGDMSAVMEEFRGSTKLKGVRHVVQDEADDFLRGKDFNVGVASLLGTGLVYDILIYDRQLPQVVEFVGRHPGQVFVLDHLAKPKVRAGVLEPWRKNLCALAEAENVYCKISGMATEADWDKWELHHLRPYLDAALDAFGPDRLMIGSDWPVCLVASDYGRWWDTVREWLHGVSAEDRDRMLGENAKRVYGL